MFIYKDVGIQYVNKLKRILFNESFLSGNIWMLMSRILERSISTVKLIIASIYLGPVDFGLLGIATLTLSIIERITVTGFEEAIISDPSKDEKYFDVSWTIQVLRGTSLALLLFGFSTVIGNFFGQAQSIQIIRAFALILLLKSFINTEIFNIKRDLDFKKYFIYQIIPIFVDLALTVIALFVLQNVWALIIGAIIKQVIALILSFIICSRKPKVSFNLVIIKELFKYGRWIGISSIIILIATEGDDVFVAKYIGVAALGLYQMAYLISNSPTTEISHVMGQALLPYFSNKWRGLEIQRIIFTKMYIVVGMGIAVLSTMIYFLIDDFVILFLRDNWVGLIPLVRVLVIAGYFRAFAAITGSTLVALNKPHYDTMLQIVRLVILVIIGYFAFVMYGLIGIAWAVTISIAVSFLGYFIVSYKVLGFRVREVSYTFVYFISLFLLVKLVVLGIDGVGIESGFGRGVLEITGIIASAIAIEILLGKKAFLMLIEILKDKSVVQ